MDGAAAIAKADALWRRGQRQTALALMREHARAHPTDHRARLALAERYRALDAPDQAGRWGITIEGWTTTRERDRAARLIAASRVATPDLVTFLALPETGLPAAVVDLLPAVEQYRERFALTAHERSMAQERDRLEESADGVALITAGVVVLVALGTSGTALLGLGATGFARWGAVVVLALMAVSFALRSVRCGRRRQWSRTATYAWLTVLLAAGVGALTTDGILHGGAIVFR